MIIINDFIFPQTVLETKDVYYIRLLWGNEMVSVILVMLVNYFQPQFPHMSDGEYITTYFSRIAIWIAWYNGS